MDPVTAVRLARFRQEWREQFRGTLCESRKCVRCGAVHIALRAAPMDAPCLECSTRAPSPRVALTHAAATHEDET